MNHHFSSCTVALIVHVDPIVNDFYDVVSVHRNKRWSLCKHISCTERIKLVINLQRIKDNFYIR